MKTRSSGECPTRNCTRAYRAWRRRCALQVSASGIASRATCRTCRRRSSRRSRPAQLARSGPPPRLTSACRVCSIASGRSSRRSSSPSTGTGTTARRSPSSTRSRASSSACRRCCALSSHLIWDLDPRAWRVTPAHRVPSRGTTSLPHMRRVRSGSRRCRSIIRCSSCIRRGRRVCRSASFTVPGVRCCST